MFVFSQIRSDQRPLVGISEAHIANPWKNHRNVYLTPWKKPLLDLTSVTKPNGSLILPRKSSSFVLLHKIVEAFPVLSYHKVKTFLQVTQSFFWPNVISILAQLVTAIKVVKQNCQKKKTVEMREAKPYRAKSFFDIRLHLINLFDFSLLSSNAFIHKCSLDTFWPHMEMIRRSSTVLVIAANFIFSFAADSLFFWNWLIKHLSGGRKEHSANEFLSVSDIQQSGRSRSTGFFRW